MGQSVGAAVMWSALALQYVLVFLFIISLLRVRWYAARGLHIWLHSDGSISMCQITG